MTTEHLTLAEVKTLIKDPKYQWRDQALCLGMDTTDWIFERDLRGQKIAKVYEDAIKICEECPVRSECLAFAIEWKCFDGVWGGTMPHQRKGLHNNQKVRDLFPERRKR